MKTEHKKQFGTYGYAVAAAFAVLMICSRSSFLYPFNIWDDANSYFTMGKSMMRGMVPYRDLFDQKGILLYFLYGIGYLISHTTFAGVFLLEVIAGTLTVVAILRILQMYVSAAVSYLLMPVTMALMYSARSFYWGGSAEEFLLPALLWGIVLLLRYWEEIYPAPLPGRTVFLGGILAGCVLHTKFNSLGFYVGWVIFVLIADAVTDAGDRMVRVVRHALLFLAGIVIVTLPFFLYFMMHDAVDDWFRVYIYDNLFLYSEKLPMGERLYEMVKTVYHQAMANKRFSIPVLLGYLIGMYRALRARERRCVLSVLSLILTGVLLIVVIFIGGVDLPYYPFPVSAFTVIGIVQAAGLAETQLWRVPPSVAGVAGIVLAGGVCVLGSMNVKDIGEKKEALWLYKMREHILASGVQEPKLINMGGFDAGLYTVMDVLPECYYFQTQTIPIPGIWETQKDYVKSQRPDYVLSCAGYLDFDTSGYHVAMQEVAEISGYETHFWLYESDRIGTGE